MTNPNINNQPSEPANEAQLDGLLVQTQMAVAMGGAEGYFENDNNEMTTMFPERQGSEVRMLVPEAADTLGIQPQETVTIGLTMATSGYASALVEVANPEGEDYSHYSVEKKPDELGEYTLTGNFYNTSMDKGDSSDQLDLDDLERFPFEGMPPLDYKEKSKEELEAEFEGDNPLDAEGHSDEGSERYFAVARGRELTSDQVIALGKVIGALTYVPPGQS